MLLKTVLKLGYTINTNYGNNRRKATAFKICSLLLTKNYKGTHEHSLIKFVAETTRGRLRTIKTDLKEIESIKNDELNNYRELINEYILEYNNYKVLIDELDTPSRANLKAFLFYFGAFVKSFPNHYKEALVYASIIKRKFGEPESKNVKEIIGTLYEFLKSIQFEIEK